MIQLYADKSRLAIRELEPLVSGAMNTIYARFTFSPEWEGFEKTAVFRAGEKSVSQLLDDSGMCPIPWEVLEKPGVTLIAGVYGTREDGSVVLPTVWASLRTILEGAVPGEYARPPTPDLWEQELGKKGDRLDYDGLNLRLMSGENTLSSVEITGGGGAVAYRFGHGLKQEGLNVSVDAVSDFNGDNTLPMTAAGVYATLGNIEALLGSI